MTVFWVACLPPLIHFWIHLAGPPKIFSRNEITKCILYILLCDFTHTFYSKYNKIGCRYFWSLPDNWKTAKYLDTLVRSQSSVLFLVGMWWLTGSYLLIWMWYIWINFCRMTLSCFLCTAHNFHRKYCYQSFIDSLIKNILRFTPMIVRSYF